MNYHIQGVYQGKAVFKEAIAGAPSNQGGGVLECTVLTEPDEPNQVIYVNVAGYDVIKITQVTDE